MDIGPAVKKNLKYMNKAKEAKHQNIDILPIILFFFLQDIGSFISPIILSLDLLSGDVFTTRVL